MSEDPNGHRTARPGDLDLLLARRNTGAPVLRHPLGADVGARLSPQRRARDGPRLGDAAAPAGSLPGRRWGLVAPEGPRGDEICEAIAPLVARRTEDQGTRILRYRAPAGLRTADAVGRWLRERVDCGPRGEFDRPDHVLVLGDAEQIPLEVDHQLAVRRFVGRLDFERTDDYAAYATKVAAAPPPGPSPRPLLVHSSLDGTLAINVAYAPVARPCLDGGAPDLRGVQVREIPHGHRRDDVLAQAAGAEGSVLFSVAHGAAAPDEGWPNAETQRAEQGALLLGPDHLLCGADVARGRFLPGGIWCLLTCYGAATPAESVFAPWLARMARNGQYTEDIAAIRENQPLDGRPFIAALPRAALANPDGPVAVIGHSDLAWQYVFRDPREPRNARAVRLHALLAQLCRGGPAGLALHGLRGHAREIDDALALHLDREPETAEAAAWNNERMRLWLMRYDLRGYMRLGDPFAALIGGVTAPALRSREVRTVLDLLAGRTTGADAARALGVRPERVESWARAFVDAGAAAVDALARRSRSD